jgi:hypothetical protein
VGRTISSTWLAVLPRLSTLTSLSLSHDVYRQPVSALTLFQLIGAHNLPQLSELELTQLAPMYGESQSRQLEQLLRQMGRLTCLSVVMHDTGDDAADWLSLLHCLPSLLKLRLDDFCDADPSDRPRSVRLDACLQSVSASPRLQSLYCSVSWLAERLAQLWWRRLGEPQLDLSEFAEDQWAELQERLAKFEGDTDSNSAVTSAAVASSGASASSSGPAAAISELQVPHLHALNGCVIAYLAHLPQLHSLECALRPSDIRHLSLLRQLRSLTLRLKTFGSVWEGPQWTTAPVRDVGDACARLPLLHTLRLEGNNEDPADGGNPANPDFDWDYEHWDSHPTRATHADVPVEDGLECLLQPPSLTRLTVPYVSSESLDVLRSLAAADGRRELRIERIVPMSQRSDLDKRWIDHNTPTTVQSYSFD